MRQQNHPLLSASLGTQRHIVSFHFGEESERQVYIQAALHGDELPGMAVAWYLKQRLLALESAGKLNAAITLVPVANPLALAQHSHGIPVGRFHTLSGQNFNRQFPLLGDALAPALLETLTSSMVENKQLIRDALDVHFRDRIPHTELDSQRFILMRIASQADLMIDLHSDMEALPHLSTTRQAWPHIEPLARRLGSQVHLLTEDAAGESFDKACCEPWNTLKQRFGNDYPIPDGLQPVTFKLCGMRDISPHQAEQDAEAIIHALIDAGFISGKAPPLPPLAGKPTPLAGCEYLSAPHSGLILYRRELGERVKAGEVVAEIVDPNTDLVTPLIAEYGGLFYARHWIRFATAGMMVARLAGEHAHRKGSLQVT
ncbi:succinylglutamate desuccinylase/aspartoacylase domain-containing protein [[Erwinia] mediterraneensis]|uniref:succinylglutamate desuccinylase/aspartoacylase domain-containing protein n=1 Tax=[Erwinia] mediterraneensis TaxID=2161819 RepID=UPI001031831A|nr:succinylglutamate desuccinylase/aspartoacylase family protein [[Erwinia] mediterraneensis]